MQRKITMVRVTVVGQREGEWRILDRATLKPAVDDNGKLFDGGACKSRHHAENLSRLINQQLRKYESKK